MRFSQFRRIIAATACIGALAATTTAAKKIRGYAAIDAPNASFTTAQGVNSRGDVVGWYVDRTSRLTHGYLLRDGEFTQIDYPGAAYTDARGVNARGEVVGAYRRPGEPAVNFHGYLRTRHGEFLAVDYPGHTNTIPQRITSRGVILGCRHDGDLMDTMRGITIDSRKPEEVSELNVAASMNNGSTSDGNPIVGLFTDMDGRGRAYLSYGDTFIPFDAPGSTLTAGWDVNADGAAVGVYRDAANRIHGFLWEDLRFTAIDYPGATATRAFGINSRGTIVGAYLDTAGVSHGFVTDRMRDDDER